MQEVTWKASDARCPSCGKTGGVEYRYAMNQTGMPLYERCGKCGAQARNGGWTSR